MGNSALSLSPLVTGLASQEPQTQKRGLGSERKSACHSSLIHSSLFYSCLSASMGSTFAARRAGM